MARKSIPAAGMGLQQLIAAQVRAASRISRDFFDRDPVTVARALLGKLLVRRDGRILTAGRIVEDEAYLGQEDPAAHASAGKTPRNFVLFGPPGHAYVYFIYGNHYCLNVSCQPEGQAGCVLFRAMQPVFGLAAMCHARGLAFSQAVFPTQLRALSSGPGRMCEAMGITRLRDNNKDLTSPKSDLWLADDGFCPEDIVATPRIGVTKAAERPLRFLIRGNSFVSGKRIA
jgi:DNA-3-methyladenine glycosylase